MLRFPLGPIPVGIQPWFWVLAVLLGLGAFDGADLLIWVAVVFVSVLVHEMGHAVTAYAYGARPRVVLHAFGGLTSFDATLSAGRRVLVTLAGPAAGFLLSLAGWVLFDRTSLGDPGEATRLALGALIWVNLVWGIFNLVPIRGLDGGQTVAGVLEIVAPNKPWIAEGVFVVTGIAAIVYGFVAGYPLLAFVAAILTFGSYLDDRRSASGEVQAPTAELGEEGPPRLNI